MVRGMWLCGLIGGVPDARRSIARFFYQSFADFCLLLACLLPPELCKSLDPEMRRAIVRSR